MTDTADAVILHLWQAVQIVIDLAVSSCVQMGLGAPASYGEAFRRLADAQVLDRIDELKSLAGRVDLGIDLGRSRRRPTRVGVSKKARPKVAKGRATAQAKP